MVLKMAFNIDVDLVGYEFRGFQAGVSAKTGKNWLSIIVEHPDNARQVNVSVPEELQVGCYNLALAKGEYIDLHVVAVATQSYNFIRLVELPVRVTNMSSEVDY